MQSHDDSLAGDLGLPAALLKCLSRAGVPVESLLRGELYSGFPWSGQEGKGVRAGDRAANRKGLWAGLCVLGEGSTVW